MKKVGSKTAERTHKVDIWSSGIMLACYAFYFVEKDAHDAHGCVESWLYSPKGSWFYNYWKNINTSKVCFSFYFSKLDNLIDALFLKFFKSI